MATKLEKFIGLVTTNAPPSKEFPFYDFPAYWAYYGSAGRALTFWKLYLNFRDSDPAKA
jgi:hypothetical protein